MHELLFASTSAFQCFSFKAFQMSPSRLACAMNLLPGPNPFRWQDLTSAEIFKGLKVVGLALPGAFTATCSSNHLPRYEELNAELVSQGVDQIICLSVNDAFVIFHWSKHLGAKNIFMLPDGNGEFTRKMGMLVEKTSLCFALLALFDASE